MKKQYEKLEMEVIIFKKEDVVVASNVVLPVDEEHDNSYVNFSSFFEN